MFRVSLISIIMFGMSHGVNSQEANTLSEMEEKAGYDLLFNGTDFDGWHEYQLTRVTSRWQIKSDGSLGPRIETTRGGGKPLMSDKLYQNFDFKADVKTRVNGNSGIFFRYQEIESDYGNFRSGPEFQICDVQHHDCKNSIHSFGACYEMFPVVEEIRTNWYNPPGQWNHVRVIAYDSNYVHYGNGKKLLEYKIGTESFISRYDQSKYKVDGNNGNYYDIHEGSILLQQHGEEEMAFRNLRAKTLEIHPFLQEFPDGKWPDELSQDYVFGKRGCTNPEAINYDETAVVDDSTCETGTSIRNPGAWKNLEVFQQKSGSNEYLLELNFDHTSLSAFTIRGKKLNLSKHGEIYSLSLSNNYSGVVVLKININGTNISKPIKF